MDDRQPVSLARRALSYLICYLVAVQPMLPVMAAEITPVTRGRKWMRRAMACPWSILPRRIRRAFLITSTINITWGSRD